MSSNIEIRWYIEEAIDAIYTYFRTHKIGNPVLAMPTGTGKSHVIAKFITQVVQKWPGQQIMMLTHRKELIRQNGSKVFEYWKTAPLGYFSAGIGEKIAGLPITFAGIQSVHRSKELFRKHIDIIFVDECHLINPKQFGMYREFIDFLLTINPRLRVVGLSATPWRLGQGMLTEEGLFNDLIYDLTTPEMWQRLIAEKYLCKPITKATKTHIDISGVKIIGGEFNQSQIANKVDQDSINRSCVREVMEYGYDRWSWLIFAASIEHAEHLATIFQEFGCAVECVHSKLSDIENDRRISDFKSGVLRGIVNNDKLTTGFDHPPTDLIALIRHTMSSSLNVQMVGRGTRPYDYNNPTQYIPGFEFVKNNCLVLDFAQNCERLGPINNPVLPKKKSGLPGDMIVKICPECGVYNFGAARYCDNCGFEFQFKLHIDGSHDTDAVVFQEPEEDIIERVPILHVAYKIYRKSDATLPMLQARYVREDNLKIVLENVLFEHSGRPRQKAIEWFQQRFSGEVPHTCQQALSYHAQFRTPRFLRLVTNRKYPEILSAEF